MEIGEIFTFLSHDKKRKAIFKSKENDKIKAIMIGEMQTQGVEITIHESQIISENQISIFDLE